MQFPTERTYDQKEKDRFYGDNHQAATKKIYIYKMKTYPGLRILEQKEVSKNIVSQRERE